MCIYFLPKHNCVHKCMCFMNHFSTYFQKNYFIDYLKHKLHAHMRSHINGCTQTHVDICVYANADTSTTEVVVLERHACLHSPKLLLSCAGTIRTYLYIPWHMRTSHSDNPASLGKSLYAHTHIYAHLICPHVYSVMYVLSWISTLTSIQRRFTYGCIQFPHKQTYICISQQIWVHLILKADPILISVPLHILTLNNVSDSWRISYGFVLLLHSRK